MNKAAIMLCQGDLLAAKNQLNELLEDQNLRVVQTEPTADGMIPDYLIKTLLYFLIVTSKCQLKNLTFHYHSVENNKMARHVTKYRRFVLDTGHQEQAPGASSASLGGLGQMGPGGADMPGSVGSQMAAGVDAGDAMGSMGGVGGGPGISGAKKS